MNWAPVPIPEFSDFYEVSDAGSVRALDRYITEQSTGRRRFHKGRIVTPKLTGRYLGVSLFAKPLAQRFYIHRLVGLAFLPNPENKPCINHKNRNIHDNSIQNLEWVTYAENSQHFVQSPGFIPSVPPKGEHHHSSKFNEIAVRHLRLYWKPGDSCKAIATKYQVTPAAIYKMLRGDTWKHVDPPAAINWT